MTRIGVLVGVVLFMACNLACATQPIFGQFTEREVAFDGCRFKLKDPYNGTLDVTESRKLANYAADINPKARHPFETWIQFSCENPAMPKTLSELAGIMMTGGGWELDPSPESVGPKEAHTIFRALHGKAWDAGGVTQDDINGDEERRTRVFAFCIPHRNLALCGVVRHVGYLEHLNESTLPQVIHLLQSIEFIDDAQVAPANSSTAPSPNH